MNLTLVQVAESFGVPESVVERWARRGGLPHARDGDHFVFDRAQVTEWAARQGLAARAGFLVADPLGGHGPPPLGPLVRAGGIWRDVAAADVPDALVRAAGNLSGVPASVGEMLRRQLASPSGVSAAPVGHGYALPHPATRISLGPSAGVVAVLLLRDPWPVGPVVDDVPITRLLFFVAPTPRAHLDLLGTLCRAVAGGPLRVALDRAAADAEILAAVDAVDRAAGRRPPEGRGA